MKTVVCAHFGHCQQFSIVDVDNNAIVSKHGSLLRLMSRLLRHGWPGVSHIIAGGMGQRALVV